MFTVDCVLTVGLGVGFGVGLGVGLGVGFGVGFGDLQKKEKKKTEILRFLKYFESKKEKILVGELDQVSGLE